MAEGGERGARLAEYCTWIFDDDGDYDDDEADDDGDIDDGESSLKITWESR